MRQYMQAVLERERTFTADFQTEPYETAWAGEAIFYIKAHEVEGESPRLLARVQMSADGLDWVDEGTELAPLSEGGVIHARVRHFGGWLRLACRLEGTEPRFTLTIHLILKE